MLILSVESAKSCAGGKRFWLVATAVYSMSEDARRQCIQKGA